MLKNNASLCHQYTKHLYRLKGFFNNQPTIAVSPKEYSTIALDFFSCNILIFSDKFNLRYFYKDSSFDILGA